MENETVEIKTEEDLIKLFGQPGGSSYSLKAISDWLIQAPSEPDPEK